MNTLTNAQRIADIEREISGVKSQYNITDFEMRVMETMKKQKFGSEKQQAILSSIERKVFGKDRENEETKISFNNVKEA